jgi:hypothetical protein
MAMKEERLGKEREEKPLKPEIKPIGGGKGFGNLTQKEIGAFLKRYLKPSQLGLIKTELEALRQIKAGGAARSTGLRRAETLRNLGEHAGAARVLLAAGEKGLAERIHKSLVETEEDIAAVKVNAELSKPRTLQQYIDGAKLKMDMHTSQDLRKQREGSRAEIIDPAFRLRLLSELKSPGSGGPLRRPTSLDELVRLSRIRTDVIPRNPLEGKLKIKLINENNKPKKRDRPK